MAKLLAPALSPIFFNKALFLLDTKPRLWEDSSMDKSTATSKVEANYIKDGGEAPCSGCVNFLPPASCKLVSGTISPEGSCDLYSSPAAEPLAGAAPLPDLMTQLFGGSNG